MAAAVPKVRRNRRQSQLLSSSSMGDGDGGCNSTMLVLFTIALVFALPNLLLVPRINNGLLPLSTANARQNKTATRQYKTATSAARTIVSGRSRSDAQSIFLSPQEWKDISQATDKLNVDDENGEEEEEEEPYYDDELNEELEEELDDEGLDDEGGGDDISGMEEDFEEKLDRRVLNEIVAGRLHLVGIEIDTSSNSNNDDQNNNNNSDNPLDNMLGSFCRLDWKQHKDKPAEVPMFRTLVAASNCRKRNNLKYANLGTVMRAIQEFDEKNLNNGMSTVPHNLKISGLVFHESRCGSTLVSNVLVAADPQRHRVYSEAQPPTAALKACMELNCRTSQQTSVLRDVLTIMSRSDDPNETKVFFKLQSINSLPDRLERFLRAAPDVPWIYVFRDPVQVMMSHLGCRSGDCEDADYGQANCVKHSRMSRPYMQGKVSLEMLCAAHLALLTESAAKYMDSNGLPVEYHAENLFQNLVSFVLPNHFGVPVVEMTKNLTESTDPQALRLASISGQYSKGGHPPLSNMTSAVFHSDSAAKEEEASDAIKEAAQLFMDPSYQRLKQMLAGPTNRWFAE